MTFKNQYILPSLALIILSLLVSAPSFAQEIVIKDTSGYTRAVSKIEELGSGAVYCQILDAVHPGKISLSKVNWKAKIDY